MRAEKIYYPLMVNRFLNTTSVAAWMAVIVSSHSEFRIWLSKSPRNIFTLKQISHSEPLSMRNCLSSVKKKKKLNQTIRLKLFFTEGMGLMKL